MNNFTNLKKISRKFNIPLIEDAAALPEMDILVVIQQI